MSKFNKTLVKKTVHNLAGGEAFKMKEKNELISLILNSFISDEFYRSSDHTLDRMKELVSSIDDKKFVAKLAIYARDKFGMRSVSAALAAELASDLSGLEWSKDFYDKVVIRVDDMMEIFSYYLKYKTDANNPKFSSSMKKGFRKAFNRFDDYQLAKHKSDKKSTKLVDIVNIVHPVPTVRNEKSLKSLVDGKLKSFGTWESKLSEAGQKANSKEELDILKSESWKELILSKRIGYFALLRNIRNIINQSPDVVDQACDLLVDENLIKKSRVLPFRFSKAYDEIYKMATDSISRKVLIALDKAINISIDNVPKFDGETLVVLDTSGSMSGRPSEIASLFASIIIKKNNCDLMTFSHNSNYHSYNTLDSLMTLRSKFRFTGGGTNFKSIFKNANKAYDRIIILSDMQGWIGYSSPSKDFSEYKRKYNANPFIYSWDLAGYGTLQLPENNVFALAGFSDKVFDYMNLLEKDRNIIINDIESIKI